MRIKLSFFFIFCLGSIIAQERSTLISLEIEDKTIEETLDEIENITKYKFYFSVDWLGSDTISKTYRDVSIEFLLDDLLSDTNLNYYKGTDNRIILLSNTSVREKLPRGFFKLKNDTIQNTTITEPAAPSATNRKTSTA